MNMENMNDENIRKAAILLISLGPETSSQILKSLPEKDIQRVTYEIANIDYVSPEEKQEVIDEFVGMASGRQYVLDGGMDYAEEILNKGLGPQKAKDVLDTLTQIQQREKPFAIARKADPQQLANLLKNEHPQTTALIMCYIQPDKAALILSEFPEELQSEIAERIGTIGRTSPKIVRKIESIMEEKFSTLEDGQSETVGGVSALVDILNSVDRSTEKNILSSLEDKQPELAENIKFNLFTFEDIATLDRGSIQRILRDIDNDDLTLALKGASEDVAEIIYENMSDRAEELIREEIEFMGPVRLSSIEEAQQRIVAIVRQLDEEGEIIIGRGDQDVVIL